MVLSDNAPSNHCLCCKCQSGDHPRCCHSHHSRQQTCTFIKKLQLKPRLQLFSKNQIKPINDENSGTATTLINAQHLSCFFFNFSVSLSISSWSELTSVLFFNCTLIVAEKSHHTTIIFFKKCPLSTERISISINYITTYNEVPSVQLLEVFMATSIL